jgi:hypothetical protein
LTSFQHEQEAMIVASRSSAGLHPALEYEGEIYKAPLNGQHLDALPEHLANEFHQKAMTGEDISKFSFGFVNDKGDFLNREDALKYAIDVGLLHKDSARYLTSTMLLTCSKSRARSSNPASGVHGSPMKSRPR